MTYLDDVQDQQDQQSGADDLSNSGLRPETTEYLNSLAGIGTQAYLAMRDPDLPEYEDWRDSNFASDDSGNYVSREGQSYTDDQLEHMHGFLSRQAGNPFVSGLFDGPDSPIADYMVWRNQNFSNDNGPWEDDDGNLYSEQALQRIFADKSASQPNGSPQQGETADIRAEQQQETQPGDTLAADSVSQPAEDDDAALAGSEGKRNAKPTKPVRLTGVPAPDTAFFLGARQPDPSWSEIREYIAQEARAYGVPVKLAEAVARHESNFDIHLLKKVKIPVKGELVDTYDRGVMQVNSTNTGSVTGPDGKRFKVDMERINNDDWKYNVHVGMALLRQAYVPAVLNTIGAENIARETYARYNSRRHWNQLYTAPGGVVSQHVNQFMKSWSLYYDSQY